VPQVLFCWNRLESDFEPTSENGEYLSGDLRAIYHIPPCYRRDSCLFSLMSSYLSERQIIISNDYSSIFRGNRF
jgi:hypothetical protein